MDIEEQYDKIYRYCYFKLQHQQMAEDITQETFLRFLESSHYCERGKRLRYLYTIARNLCMDVYRRNRMETSTDEELDCRVQDAPEEEILTGIVMKTALSNLEKEEQELLLLRYVQELSVSDICGILEISRFSVYRKTQKALKQLRNLLSREDFL